MTTIDLPAASFDAVAAAFYSIIHVPRCEHARLVIAECATETGSGTRMLITHCQRAPGRPVSQKRNAGDAVALGQQLFLGLDIVGDRARRSRALMIEIPARRSRQLVVAGGEPCLGDAPLLQIVRS